MHWPSSRQAPDAEELLLTIPSPDESIGASYLTLHVPLSFTFTFIQVLIQHRALPTVRQPTPYSPHASSSASS